MAAQPICDCADDCIFEPQRCACDEARACCGWDAGSRLKAVEAELEPWKPEPPPFHGRLMDGCTAVSPSPPAPSPRPLAPPPLVPPTPPFQPLKQGEEIQVVPVIALSVELVLQGTLDTIDRAAVTANLRAYTDCYAPCTLTTTFTAGSVIVAVEAITPAADASASNVISNTFQSLTVASTESLGDAIGVRVVGVSNQVVSQSRTAAMLIVLSPPSPRSPPQSGGGGSTPSSSGGGAGLLIAVVAGLVVVASLAYCLLKKRAKSGAKVSPHHHLPAKSMEMVEQRTKTSETGAGKGVSQPAL